MSILAAFALLAANAPISLICVGTAAKDEEVGTTLDFLGGTVRTERVGVEESIGFTINPDSTGEARLPRRMQSTYKEPIKGREGWFRLIEVHQGTDEITGKIRIHGMNKPRFRLDRLSGTVTVDGQLASFSGRCEPYDPASVQRRF